MDLFDATTMRLQIVGELLKQIDVETKEKLLITLSGNSMAKRFGLRNLISHEYAAIDPIEIVNILRLHLSHSAYRAPSYQDDLNAGKHDAIFG